MDPHRQYRHHRHHRRAHHHHLLHQQGSRLVILGVLLWVRVRHIVWGCGDRYYEEDSAKTRPSRVIVYGYDGLPIQPVAPPSPDYVPGPEHSPSPDYVPDLEHPPSPIEIPYVPEPEYLEYLAPSDDEAPLEDQPLPADASPIAA
nr:hypothetical protein [Tanacetum cinerariifolium]